MVSRAGFPGISLNKFSNLASFKSLLNVFHLHISSKYILIKYSMHSGPSPSPPSALAPASPTPTRSLQWTSFQIGSVLIICTIFLVCSCYKVLKRLCCCACNAAIFSRNQVQGRLLDHDSNFDNNPSLQDQSNALESPVIHTLPISRFKKEKKDEVKEEKELPRMRNTDCAVCLAEFEEGEWLRHLPNCTHAFHISCIDTWFQSHSSCPLCRSSVLEVTIQPECSVSMFTIMETLRREDFVQDRSAHYQMLLAEVLRNPEHGYEQSHTGGL